MMRNRKKLEIHMLEKLYKKIHILYKKHIFFIFILESE